MADGAASPHDDGSRLAEAMAMEVPGGENRGEEEGDDLLHHAEGKPHHMPTFFSDGTATAAPVAVDDSNDDHLEASMMEATEDEHNEDEGSDEDEDDETVPLVAAAVAPEPLPPPITSSSTRSVSSEPEMEIRSRRGGVGGSSSSVRGSSSGAGTAPSHRRRRRGGTTPSSTSRGNAGGGGGGRRWHHRVCRDADENANTCTAAFVRSTLTAMNFLAKVLLWSSVVAMAAGVVWYSRELKKNGTDPHLIAWFSAGAFVLLGFPISIYGIFMHLSNYYQPNVQCYVVRILWMVPIYSIESWLCLRFHRYAIYIETLRDCYESYVLYSFLQFLIEVLGGEESLVLMLKDKSPTRGVHMWGFQWCIKPWLMGQPVSRRTSYLPLPMSAKPPSGTSLSSAVTGGNVGGGIVVLGDGGKALGSTSGSDKSGAAKGTMGGFGVPLSAGAVRPVKRVQWTSPFFVKCKVGVLQYVLLKFVSSIFVMILEIYDLYKEGDFTPKGGYLYICILTNLSQCWALYCLIFFYYATKTELGPIRPVGKFLSVKALVFFTWWQSVGISMLFQAGMIPDYTDQDTGNNWTNEDVAKGLQDYLICIEMFIGAIVHTFVFPHTDYLTPIGGMDLRDGHRHNARTAAATAHHAGGGGKRLGRKGRPWDAALMHQYRRGDDRSACSKSSGQYSDFDLEMGPTRVVTAAGGVVGVGGTMRSSPLPLDSDRRGVVGGGSKGDQRVGTDEQLLALDEVDEKREGSFRRSSIVESVAEEGSMRSSSHARSLESEDEHDDEGESGGEDNAFIEVRSDGAGGGKPQQQRQGFVRALIDSTFPRDVLDETVGMVKGDLYVEKKTLLRHAATSDEYDLFSKSKKRRAAATSRSRNASDHGSQSGRNSGSQ